MRHSSRPQPGLGLTIRQLREKRQETQEALANQAGIAVPTLSHIEAGHANPTWGTLKGIAAALSVSMGELGKLADRLDS